MAHFGELVQLDGSFHPWFEARGPHSCLLTLVDDATGRTIASASTVEPSVKSGLAKKATGGNVEGAKAIGKTIAERLIGQGVKRVVFDRNGFLYHGRVKAVADAAREAGLEF